tara:strand:- start:21 stop:947 length:927 start_codon:yes stop_codon:yes gene_type:complete
MKNINKIKITIGITVFKEKKLLLEAWKSVIEQTSQMWEAVMVFDGGGDYKTKSIFDSIEHPRLKKTTFPYNQGPYVCRTKAIELCNTEWYCHLDADDILPEDAIELILNKIDECPEAEYIFGSCKHFSLGKTQVRKPEKNKENLCYSPLFCATAPIKKKLFKRLDGFFIPKNFFHSDWDFWLNVYEQNIIGAEIEKNIYYRRRRKDGITNKNFKYLPKALEQIIERHPIFFKNKKRIRNARRNVYEKTARLYRTYGKRKLAYKYAQLAVKNGSNAPVIDSIKLEFTMPIWRFIIRRIGRVINMSIKVD